MILFNLSYTMKLGSCSIIVDNHWQLNNHHLNRLEPLDSNRFRIRSPDGWFFGNMDLGACPISGEKPRVSNVDVPSNQPSESGRPCVAQPDCFGNAHPHRYQPMGVTGAEDKCYATRIGYPGYWGSTPQKAIINLGALPAMTW